MCDLAVRVKQGKLLGTIKEGVNGTVYRAFLGVPYAAPPLGSLRFKDPLPPTPWEGIRAAMEFEAYNKCAQIDPRCDRNIFGSEDCLYLNIYVPYEWRPETSYKPVMVWIHGGDFWQGSGDYYDVRPEYFMTKDVILVTVNYRLGILGFLNLEISEASGNQGLKDQVAALYWIRENIFAFGGDPSNITVFGNGAGAISTHLLMLSPISRDLFHKAILQSGVALCNWAIGENKTHAIQLAKSMCCSEPDNPQKVLTYLQKLPSRVLIVATYKIIESQERYRRKVVFGPTIDKEASNPFLPCAVRELLNEEKNIPILIGHTTSEFRDTFYDNLDKSKMEDQDFELHVRQFAGSHNLDKVPEYTKQITKTYAPGQPVDKWDAHLMENCLSDLYYNLAIKSFLLHRMKRRNTKTYYYVFSYHGFDGRLPLTHKIDIKSWISHGEELQYMFYVPRLGDKRTDKTIRSDNRMINMITTIWSNFAKTGDPNFNYNSAFSQWKPVSENEFECFEINNIPSGWLTSKKHLVLTDDWY